MRFSILTLNPGFFRGALDEGMIRIAREKGLLEVALVPILDALARLIPGVLGDAESAEADSFSEPLLDAPVYTRPEDIESRRVPDVLLSGDHERIRIWRRREALRRTWLKRPDLLLGRKLSDEDQSLLDEIKKEEGR